MARKLNSEDLSILKKIAPELIDSKCGHAGWEFRSVLPPVSQHVSNSSGDFRERLLRLSDHELNYLVDLVFEGMESLHCVKSEHVDALIEVVGKKISKVKATELLELYKFAGDLKMPHIMELFGKTRIVVKDGKVVETGEPIADWCPVFSKVSNVSKLTSREAKKNMEYRIRELGMFTPDRRFDYGVFVNFGASEIMMTGLKHGLIDSTVTVCDGAGTVITDNPSLVQGMGALMSGLIETEPIEEIIAGIELRGGIVLDKEKAGIDQVSGLRKACGLGYKNIAVSVVSPVEAGMLRLIEKENDINLILIGAHLTGIECREAGELINKMDIITGCASKMVRLMIHPLLQAGTSVPMFALTQKGKELIIERAKEIDSPILVSTAELPVLPEHKQPRPLR